MKRYAMEFGTKKKPTDEKVSRQGVFCVNAQSKAAARRKLVGAIKELHPNDSVCICEFTEEIENGYIKDRCTDEGRILGPDFMNL